MDPQSRANLEKLASREAEIDIRSLPGCEGLVWLQVLSPSFIGLDLQPVAIKTSIMRRDELIDFLKAHNGKLYIHSCHYTKQIIGQPFHSQNTDIEVREQYRLRYAHIVGDLAKDLVYVTTPMVVASSVNDINCFNFDAMGQGRSYQATWYAHL